MNEKYFNTQESINQTFFLVNLNPNPTGLASNDKKNI